MKRVEVTWSDAFNMPAGWWDRGDAMAQADDVIVGSSCGYLVGKTKRTIVISAARSHDGKRIAGGILVIPRHAVRKMRRLKR